MYSIVERVERIENQATSLKILTNQTNDEHMHKHSHHDTQVVPWHESLSNYISNMTSSSTHFGLPSQLVMFSYSPLS